MSTIRDILARNLARVEERISAACQRAGRPRHAVTLVAVTKTVDVDVVSELIALGVRDFGENRPQELWRKSALLSGGDRRPPGVRWHLIGHLQRNKIERSLPLVHRIHSVDSLRLLEALDAAGPADVLLEFNCSGEASKGGFRFTEDAGDVPAWFEAVEKLQRLRVVGLMTMAALEEDPEKCRPVFEMLRQLRSVFHGFCGGKHPFTELSMGMSHDFEVAVEEGATMVRLGSVLFEGLQG